MAYLPVAISAGLIHAVDWLQGRGVWPARGALEASQWWPSSRLRTLQDDRLRLRTRAAAAGSPLVARRLVVAGLDAGAGIGLDDLARLAPMERDDFVHRRAEIWPAPPRDALPNSTGGSTGTNLHFFVDRACWRQRDAVDLRLWTFLGLGPGARVLSLWGAPMDLGSAALLRQRLRRFVDNRRLVSAYAIGDAALDRLLDRLARRPPDVLMGYASVLDRLAVRALRRGGLPGPRFIIPSAEALFPDQRQRLEQAWGGEVFNLYGCREVGLVALECGAHRGLHVMDERLIVEPAPSGVGGARGPEAEGQDLLITDLDNAATPFLRYRIGDRAAAADPSPCPCGRGLSRLGGHHGPQLRYRARSGGPGRGRHLLVAAAAHRRRGRRVVSGGPGADRSPRHSRDAGRRPGAARPPGGGGPGARGAGDGHRHCLRGARHPAAPAVGQASLHRVAPAAGGSVSGTPALPVLMFHSVAPPGVLAPHGWLERISTPLDLFAAMLEDWRRRGVRTMGTDDLRAYLSGRALPRRSVLLTFDDGYLDNWVALTPLLRRYDQRAVVFVSTDFIDPGADRRPTLDHAGATIEWQGYLSAAELAAMAASGHVDIESHAATHTWEFTSARIVDYYGPHWNIEHPRCRYRFLWLNRNPALKPFALQHLRRDAVPWGTPVYEFAPALVAHRYEPDPRLEEHLVGRVAGEGGERFFARPAWRAELDGEVDAFRARHGERGRPETEIERRARLDRELEGSRARLAGITGRPVRFLSPPQGGAGEETLTLARASGYDLVTAPSGGRLRLNRRGAGPGWVYRCGTGFDLFGRNRSTGLSLVAQRLVLARTAGSGLAAVVTRSVGVMRRILP